MKKLPQREKKAHILASMLIKKSIIIAVFVLFIVNNVCEGLHLGDEL